MLRRNTIESDGEPRQRYRMRRPQRKLVLHALADDVDT